MADTYRFDSRDDGLVPAIGGFLRNLMASGAAGAVLAPRHVPGKRLVMPALVTRPEGLEGVDPLAPCFPLNAASLAARLSRKPMGSRWAAVLRPCEARAWVELVKLKQARTGEMILVSIDCLGAFQNKDYIRFAGQDPPKATAGFVCRALAGEVFDPDLAPACRACEFPVPPWSDLHIGLPGAGDAGAGAASGGFSGPLTVMARSGLGHEVVEALKLEPCAVTASRQASLEASSARRTAAREAMFASTRSAIDGIEKASGYFADCVNCYNCRVACPVCYCKECVFVTEVFNHEPFQYLQWAQRTGALKLPTDTLFYHLTRLAHMSTACVGCGQCSNACPNEIPVMEVFSTIARHTQQAFGYEAGRDLEEPPPLSVFKEAEFPEVVGITPRLAAG